MGMQTPQQQKTPLCMGLLAHVDAGKTTLSEALLYVSGTKRTLGRVDHRDAFLDTMTWSAAGASPSSPSRL